MIYTYITRVNYTYEGEDADLSCYEYTRVNAENRTEAFDKLKARFPHATSFEFKEKTPAK